MKPAVTSSSAAVARFESTMRERPEVVNAHRVFGDTGFLLCVAVADLSAYERFNTEVLLALPGVARVTSHLTMKTVKEDRGLPVR